MTDPIPQRLVPLGGLGEVGMNCLSVETDRERVLVDCGLMFPSGEAALGVEVIAPDLTHLSEGPPPGAVLLTHAHEDHVGALPQLLRRFPETAVVGTRFTLAVVKAKLEEHGLSPELVEISPRKPFARGTLEVEALRVAHSVPDAVGYALRTPAGLVVHTGDFKVDWSPMDGRPLDVQRFAELGREGVSCLLSDSTNAEVPGTSASEREVAQAISRILGGELARGRVVVATFGSNVHRMQGVVQAAAAHGRKVCLLGRSMQQNARLALDLGYLDSPPDLFVDPEAADHFAPRELLVLCTGAQGEPRSALSRLALGEHPDVRLDPGDLVILSSRQIPGNERSVGAIVDHLARRGCRVLSKATPWGPIHTSGHACQGELRMLIDLVQPRSFVPIHGEYRMLAAHARLAREAGIDPRGCLLVEDGDVVELPPGGFATRSVRRAVSGRLYLDNRGAGSDVGQVTLRDRKLLADGGLVLCLCVLDRRSGEVMRGPELLGRGVSGLDDRRAAQAAAQARAALDELGPRERSDPAAVEEALRRGVRSAWKKGLEKRPLVLPVVIEL